MKRLLLAAALWLFGTPAFAGIPCTLPFNFINGTTADATQVMANYNALAACLQLAAHAGNNTDITSISGLTTPLPPAQGGSTVFVGGNGTLAANNYTVSTTVPANFTLQKGYSVIFVANAPNPGAATLNVTGTGAIPLFKQTTAGPVAMTGLEIQANDIVIAVYDGTQYQVTAPVNNTGPPVMGGRIVATNISCSSTPSVQLANITAATTLCYVPNLPGVGNLVWINGANFTYAPLTFTLNAAHQTTGNLYDLFAVVSAGAAVLCAGGNPWSAISVSAARTDAISQNINGIYQNSGTLTNCWNGTTNFGPISASAATYLGTFYANGNGQTIWNPTPAPAQGGATNATTFLAAVIGVYNAYNQVTTNAFNGDSKTAPGYTFAGTNFWQNFGASTDNRLSYVDGLGTGVGSNFYFKSDWTGNAAGVNGGGVSLCVDGAGTGIGSPTCQNGGPGTDFAPTATSWETDEQVAFTGTGATTNLADAHHWISIIGFHFVQALWVTQSGQHVIVACGNNGVICQMHAQVPN